MTETNHSHPAFTLCGGHPALDFVNSLDGRFGAHEPLERLTGYGDLVSFTAQTRLLDARQARRLRQAAPAAAARALRSAQELREALATALYARLDGRAVAPTAMHTLERHFHRAGRHRELRWEGGTERRGSALRWEWGRHDCDPELPVWLLAQSAAELLMSEQLDRVRACGAETCRWLFLDTSRNHTRRWCDMKVCGNRMKARRFHERHEA